MSTIHHLGAFSPVFHEIGEGTKIKEQLDCSKRVYMRGDEILVREIELRGGQPHLSGRILRLVVTKIKRDNAPHSMVYFRCLGSWQPTNAEVQSEDSGCDALEPNG